MPSTNSKRRQDDLPDWKSAGLPYYPLGFYLRHKFGTRVWKVSVDGGLNCPNRATSANGQGCVFCDPESFSPSRRTHAVSIAQQLRLGIERLNTRHSASQFLAYFQPGTNTYGPIERLRTAYREALSEPNVVGLIIGTRPDCVGDEVLDLLEELAGETWLRVEYGLQSMHRRSLDWMNRGHDFDAFVDAVERSRRRGLRLGAHVILGLPGESAPDMLATAREVARLGIESVKLHNLHAVRNTRLAEMVASGEVCLPEFDEYVGWAVDFMEVLPPYCVIDRLCGNAPAEYLIGPSWCQDVRAVRTAIEAEFRRRDSWQSKKWNPAE